MYPLRVQFKLTTSLGVDITPMVDHILAIIKDEVYFDNKHLMRNGINRGQFGPWSDLLIELNNRGYIVNGAGFNKGTKYFGNAHIFLGNIRNDSISIEDAKKQITKRFFHVYVPATTYDFAHWFGISHRGAEECFKSVEEQYLK